MLGEVYQMKNNYLRMLYGCLKYKIFGTGTILRIKHYITYKCDLSCPYCYIKGFKADELNTQEIKCLMDKYRSEGAVQWTFIGGEPLIREDIGDLITYAKQKGFIVGMVTNGLLIKKKIEDLKDLDKILISWLGKDLKEEISELNKRNIVVSLNFVVSNKNYKEVDEIINYSIKNKVYVNFCPMEPVNSGAKKDCLNAIQCNEIAERIDKIKSKWIITSSNNFKRRAFYLEKKIERFQEVKCLAGEMYLALLPDGKVSPCWIKFGKGAKKEYCDCSSHGFNDVNKLYSLKIIKNHLFNKWNMVLK